MKNRFTAQEIIYARSLTMYMLTLLQVTSYSHKFMFSTKCCNLCYTPSVSSMLNLMSANFKMISIVRYLGLCVSYDDNIKL